MLTAIGGIVVWVLAMFVFPRAMFIALWWYYLDYGVAGGIGLFVLTAMALLFDFLSVVK